MDVKIEALCAFPDRVYSAELVVAQGTTVAEALILLAELDAFEGLDLGAFEVGIFGEVVKDRSSCLADGDRLEFYRPLAQDPMEARRRR